MKCILERKQLALSPPSPRKLSHTRTVVYQGYDREDGLWDVEAELTDVKTHDFKVPNERLYPAHEPIHHLKIRVTLDTQVAYIWDGAWRPLNVGAWLVTSAGGNCTTYRAGTLARDVATDDLLMCQASGIWKRQLNAGAWVVVSAGTTCSAYPPGTLGRDGSDNLFMCAATDGLWRKVSAP